MRLQKVILLCLLLLLLSTVVHAKIIFSSTRWRTRGIYIMNDDGSNEDALLFDGSPYPACWSPDGKQILFKARPKWNANYVFFLMDADGTNIRQLTEDDGSTVNGGSFSPDGQSIVFNKSIQIDKKWHDGIYVLNIETEKLKK